ncbi:hypothetical protein [Winogradskyella jejuensis]|uniref:Uncharacterized protein n=1 Tax=Winogradskyella jejuensis TaxID=1089305 RepID=A0A1M5MFF4_9FLAO|nr:hypothetical protein [Winogradskyella jejuensis]SHG76144.1 hypothetical protein SAMN05444148_0888 [Winogradskyella jejuensis]
MKQIFTLGFSFCFFLLFGQEAKTEPQILTEVYSLSIGNSFEFDDYKIRFIDVLSDSRCPKAVMCVVAGEAKVVVEVYKENKKLSTKNIVFTPTVFMPNKKGNLFDSEKIKVTGVELFPYPSADNQVPKEDYKLKLLLEELVQ